MAKLAINFGTPPLGIGGDTYKSAFEKCNLNFTELYTSMTAIQSNVNSTANMTVYKDVAQYYKASSAVTGAMVIHLPKARFKSTTMLSVCIEGFNYLNNAGEWELNVGGYNYTSGWLQTSANLNGPAPFKSVKLGWATDHNVIILGEAATKWAYPRVMLKEIVGGYKNHESGWEDCSIAIEADISAYTTIVTPTLYGWTRTLTAEALATARTINGVSFNGTANITVADSTKLPLSGGTMTGRLAVDVANGGIEVGKTGAANTPFVDFHSGATDCDYDSRIIANGGTGVNGAGALTYTASGGHTFVGKIIATGGINAPITGNASTATTLQTARTINGVSFNGSANITVADSTKLPLAGGTLTGQLKLKAPTVATTVALLAKGETAPLFIPQMSVGTTYRYVPFMHGTVSSASGYHQQLSVGAYRPASSWDNSGMYLAMGGNDANPTSAYILKHTGAISHSSGAVSLEGNATTATTLKTARTINGVSFNGSANVTVPVSVTGISTNGADLNTYQTAGFFSCSTSAVAGSLLNCPTKNAFSLLVERHAGVKQTVTEYMASGHKTYIRNMYSGTWGAWARVYTSIDAPTGGQYIGNAATKAIAFNAQTIAENITIPATSNGLSAGPITINNGFTVTIATGGTWTIV